jgi:23S rRNA pseudouridine1911/1915/1917 synthase
LSPTAEHHRLSAVIPEELAGSRLDQALAALFSGYSRSRLQRWIKQGAVRVDGRVLRPRESVQGGEQVVVEVKLEPDRSFAPEDIPLDCVFEDAHLLVLNKPPGLVVHPAAGNWAGTLQNALLHHDAALAALPRAGIVHRLDKDTSGLMVVAKSLVAHKALVAALQAREVEREYLALVVGPIVAGGSVETELGRHPVDRKRMAVVGQGKPAITHYRVEERFRAHTLLRARLETGRTHQIRVHMAHLGHPIVGDPIYGGRLRMPASISRELADALQGFRRQALHATRLRLRHPSSGEWLEWQAEPPADLAALLELLRADARAAERD